MRPWRANHVKTTTIGIVQVRNNRLSAIDATRLLMAEAWHGVLTSAIRTGG